MKRTKKFLVGLLATLSVFAGSLGLAACEKNYTASETDGLLAQLEQTISQNKSDLDEKIAEMKAAYEAKDSELLATIQACKQALDELKNTYETELAILQATDGANAKAIADLKAEYDQTFDELNDLIAILQATDTTQAEKIAELVNKITALEQATRITDVKFEDNGDLTITFGDGTTKTMEFPEKSPIETGATENLHYQKIAGKEEYCVIGLGLASDSDIVISSTYKGLPVTMIGPYAFQEGYFLTSIEIPDSVTMIAPYAFQSCNSLMSVEIGNGVTTIYDGAFMYCRSLTSITIPDSVRMISSNAFSGCDRLQFKEYGNAKYLGSKTNDYFALIETKNKNLSSYTIHNDTKIIADYAFRYCDSLTSIEIPDSVTSIGGYAFENCSSLQFNEYGNAKYLGSKTNDYFALIETKSKNFSSYTIHNDTKIIADDAFRSCDSLTSIEIPDSVAYIGQAAFCHCRSLISVVIPDSITFINEEAFYDCDSLTNITFKGTKAQWNAIGKGSTWNDNVPATKVVCSDGEVEI